MKLSLADPTFSTVLLCLQNGKCSCKQEIYGCLFYRDRLVIPKDLRRKVLDMLRISHQGMEKMKSLARTVVFWPGINSDIEKVSKDCTECRENLNRPAKALVHQWIVPSKHWKRIHIDHAINFLGRNWLVMIVAFSRYPCVHIVPNTSTAQTIRILDDEFSRFWYLEYIVSDNATSFTSQELKSFCASRGDDVPLLDLRPGSSIKWMFGIVIKVLCPRTVLIRSRGKLLKRHVDQLRKLNGTPLLIHNESDTDDDYTIIIDTNSKFIDKNCENFNQETSKDLQFPNNTTIPENTRMSEANKQLLQPQSTIRRSQRTRRKPRLYLQPEWI
ncbi:hypothetical protein GJ496_000607 [Pomphorhynchus laevis]|nr:hypothetical protein GJ496_000607 [Pomphorhynchus laevis]